MKKVKMPLPANTLVNPAKTRKSELVEAYKTLQSDYQKLYSKTKGYSETINKGCQCGNLVKELNAENEALLSELETTTGLKSKAVSKVNGLLKSQKSLALTLEAKNEMIAELQAELNSCKKCNVEFGNKLAICNCNQPGFFAKAWITIKGWFGK